MGLTDDWKEALRIALNEEEEDRMLVAHHMREVLTSGKTEHTPEEVKLLLAEIDLIMAPPEFTTDSIRPVYILMPGGEKILPKDPRFNEIWAKCIKQSFGRVGEFNPYGEVEVEEGHRQVGVKPQVPQIVMELI